ncbi:hypothetical protein J3R82DRAFT_1458 [Butyriboletus roseoflavus]|nr:hypothetical protein J3R82DRAFT_1458 [Butyriboletus roseoflavus]
MWKTDKILSIICNQRRSAEPMIYNDSCVAISPTSKVALSPPVPRQTFQLIDSFHSKHLDWPTLVEKKMSAYGVFSPPTRSSNLPATAWSHPRDPRATVILFHVDPSTLVDAHRQTGLFEYLHAVFADEVETGLTYPQEDMRDPHAFRAYFLAADVIIAIVAAEDRPRITPDPHPLAQPVASEIGVGVEVNVDLEAARAERSWDACVVGFYYVKPNYPGRSSHVSRPPPFPFHHKEIVGSLIMASGQRFAIPKPCDNPATSTGRKLNPPSLFLIRGTHSSF